MTVYNMHIAGLRSSPISNHAAEASPLEETCLVLEAGLPEHGWPVRLRAKARIRQISEGAGEIGRADAPTQSLGTRKAAPFFCDW